MYFEQTLDMSEWSFPEIDASQLPTVDMVESADAQGVDQMKAEKEADGVEAMEGGDNEAAQEDANHAAQMEVENLKREYEAKINVLNNLLNKLKNPTSILDEELIELVQDIVKKITKKIIRREIETDNSLLLKMIDELKALIDAKNGMLSIYMSPVDLTRLEAEKMSGLANVDDSLGAGDIVIKSNFAEVRALLSDRIEQLIRIQHD